MPTQTVALLNAAYGSDNARRNFVRDLPCDVDAYDVTDGDLPDLADVSAAVVTGSKASTYWDEPWIDDLRAWISNADDAGIPLLGICFGHQIIADALGGEVADMGEYELGYHDVEQVDDSPLFEGVDERFVAFTTHHDAVAALPPGSQRIAENEYAVQGYQRGHTFGLQFHPEFDRDTALRVTEGKDLPEAELDAALGTITDENVDTAARVKRVFENFCTYAATVTGEHGQAAADD
ncbi:MAG: type 1 glutamine amidotransferase [Haloferacaceae archaeon]